MPGQADIALGNVQIMMLLQATLSPTIVNTVTAPEQTFTVNGLQVGDFVEVQKPTAQAGLGISGARVTAANTLGIQFVNPTAGNITPTAAEVYLIKVTRPENPGVALPTALV
jgi:hypothetical protein